MTATDILRFPAQLPLLGGIEPYGRLIARLHEVLEAPEALLVFPYDWRRSIEPAARRLEDEAAAHLARWRARREYLGLEPAVQPSLTLVCHSMGGLVARYAVEVLGGIKANVRGIVTLGTPFHGAVKALRILATGKYLPLGLLAASLRDAGRTLPGLYELIARYPVPERWQPPPHRHARRCRRPGRERLSCRGRSRDARPIVRGGGERRNVGPYEGGTKRRG